MARCCCSAQQFRTFFVALHHYLILARPYCKIMDKYDFVELVRHYLDLWDRQLRAGAFLSPSEALLATGLGVFINGGKKMY